VGEGELCEVRGKDSRSLNIALCKTGRIMIEGSDDLFKPIDAECVV